MKNSFIDKQLIKEASRYIAATILCALILCFLLKLWRADLRVPLHYNGDALIHTMFIKSIIDNGWYWQNSQIGAPGGLQMYDLPAVDNSAAVIIAVIGLFAKDPFLVLNLFYLLTYPLVTISALYVFRQLNFSYPTSLFGSLVYTFLPYHFMRGESHLFLSAYYFIPLVALVLVWVASDRFTGGRGPFGINLRSPKFVLSVVFCVLVGSNGVYYPFFSCFLLLVAGLSAAFVKRSWKPLAVAVVLIAVTFVVLLAHHAPTLIYTYKHGDAGIAHRSIAGPEIYSLKVSQLLLPISGHRVERLNQIKHLYNQNTNVTESDAAALGFIGSIGFLVLLAQLFLRRSNDNALLSDLSVLNIFAVLLATIGGFGSLFALFVSASIRSYNRISVFIAFFSLIAIVLGLEWVYVNRVKAVSARIVFYFVLGVVLILAVLDQSSRAYIPEYAEIKSEFKSDEDFIHRLDSALPKDAMVFQLPYVPFPEHPRFKKMVDYDHLRGYLHSQDLRWSYGTMKNRPGDLWLKQISALPVEQMIESLAFAGFSGIYIDRNGYTQDEATALEAQVRESLQVGPVASENGRLVFFKTTDYTSRLRQRYSESDWAAKETLTLYPVILDWRGGFSGLESMPEKTWRWSSDEGELRFHNTSQRARLVSLEMSFVSGYAEFADLIISGLVADQLKVNVNPLFYKKTVTIPPGESSIKFTCNGRRVDAPVDPRVLVFRIENFKMTVLE
jgi:phosphoglycerol transferase